MGVVVHRNNIIVEFLKMNSQSQPSALINGDIDAISINGNANKLFDEKNIEQYEFNKEKADDQMIKNRFIFH